MIALNLPVGVQQTYIMKSAAMAMCIQITSYDTWLDVLGEYAILDVAIRHGSTRK